MAKKKEGSKKSEVKPSEPKPKAVPKGPVDHPKFHKFKKGIK